MILNSARYLYSKELIKINESTGILSKRFTKSNGEILTIANFDFQCGQAKEPISVGCNNIPKKLIGNDVKIKWILLYWDSKSASSRLPISITDNETGQEIYLINDVSLFLAHKAKYDLIFALTLVTFAIFFWLLIVNFLNRKEGKSA